MAKTVVVRQQGIPGPSGPKGDKGDIGSPGTLAYAQSSANTSAFTTLTDLVGLSATVTMDGVRRIKITGDILHSATDNATIMRMHIREGSTSLIFRDYQRTGAGNGTAHIELVLVPSSGAHTYKLSAERIAGTGTLTALSTAAGPAVIGSILIEDAGT